MAIENGSATDVLEMDAASNNGVDNIRDIRDEVVYTPSSLRYRVYIVDEVHMLSSSAFNALLKTLEEPPAHVIFVLATTELHKLPATIVSRCQRFDFRRIATAVLSARITYIAKEEGISLTSDAAERIARMAQGGMRDAISLLELCAGGGRAVDIATVNEMMGSVGREGTLSLVEAVLDANYDAIFAAVDEAVAASRDLEIFWQDLIALYRDLLVMKTTTEAARYLDLADTEAAALSALADRFKKGMLLAHCRLLEDALFAMQKANAVKRMVAELTLVRLCDPRLDTSVEGLLARVERLEEAAVTGGFSRESTPTVPQAKNEVPPVATPDTKPAAPAAPTVKPKAPAPEAAVKVVPGSKSIPQKPVGTGRVLTRMRGFANCVARMARDNAMVASFLGDARAFLDEAGRVVVVLPNAFAEMMLEQGNGRDALRHALCLELQREVRDGDLIMETAENSTVKTDTVIDDILSAAEQNGQA